jgi:hypothetical protein
MSRKDERFRSLRLVAIFLHGPLAKTWQFNGRNGNPCEATVSDGTSHIRATFDQVATDLFAEMNGRDFLEIRGGVIALLDYNIVSLVIYT